MPMSTADIDKFLSGVHLARVATVRKDGRPHVAPVWYLWEEGVLYFESAQDSVKARNLKNDPRLAVTIDVTAGGMRLLYVIMEGSATLIEERSAAKQIARKIYARYVGEEGLQTPSVQAILNGDFLIARMKPDKIISLDQLGPPHISSL